MLADFPQDTAGAADGHNVGVVDLAGVVGLGGGHGGRCLSWGESGGGKVVKAPQASQARPAPHCVGRLLRRQSPREKPPLTGEVAAEQAGRALDVSGGGKFAVSVVGGGVLDAPRSGQDPSLRCKPLKGCHVRLRGKCERAADERGEGGRQPAPSKLAGG